MYPSSESANDVKDSNGNVAQVQNFQSVITDLTGFQPCFFMDSTDVYPWPPVEPDDVPSPPSIDPFPTLEQYYLDVVNGIATIQANCEIKEVRVIINGRTKFYKLIPDEEIALIPDEEIATTNDSVQPSSQPKSKHRHKRRTPSKEEKRYYKRFGDRFCIGNSICRNEIIKEILEYQSTHPNMEWNISDKDGIYNFLYNNFARK